MNKIMHYMRALLTCGICSSILMTASLNASPSQVDKTPDFAPFVLDKRVEREDYNLRFGPVFVDIIGTFGVEYNDNINTSETDPIDDFILQPGISFGLKWQLNETSELDMNIGMEYWHYLSESDLNEFDNQLGLTPNTELSFRVLVGDLVFRVYDRLQYSFDSADSVVIDSDTGDVIDSDPEAFTRFNNVLGVQSEWFIYETENGGDSESVLLSKDDDRFIFAEACRNLRTSVFFMGDDEVKPSVFAVTSAIPSEGKSTVSANLAVALSFSHSKVLLIDADLRRGRLHKLFDLSIRNGLSQILDGKLGFTEAIQQTAYDNLDFISIGGHPDHPAELLMSENMAKVIAEAREAYDFVIFDTAPILATDDTTSFAGQMDALLFTIRCAHTQLRQVKPAMARLKERNIDVSGLILNCVDTNQPGYYYYRYSEYYTDPNRNKESSEAANSA